MSTVDRLTNSSEGWVTIEIGDNASMVVYNQTPNIKVKFRLGSDDTLSEGIDFVYNTPVSTDEDVYVKVLPGYNNSITEAMISKIVSPT